MFKIFKKDENGYAAMIGAVVALLVAIAVGVLIWYKLNTSLHDAALNNGHPMVAANATWATLNTTANTIWTLFPIVGIVVIAGIILAIVMNFGRGNGV